MSTLLTGATGFIGGYVLHELLERGEPVWALVRARDADHALARLWEGIQLHTSAVRLREHLTSGRLRLVTGDLRLPRLGLDPAAHDELLEAPRRVVHAAASLNRRSARSCFDVNLRGGLEVILLARGLHERGRLLRLGFVSTVAVAGVRRREVVGEDAAIDWSRSDYDPYARTKKFGEHLVRELLPDAPVVVVRPSIVMGDSRFPETTQFDMVRAFVRLAQAPVLPFDPDARLDIVPADFVARALVHLLLAERTRHDTYHLSAGASAVTFRAITSGLARDLGRRRPLYVPRLGGPVSGAIRGLAQLRRGRASRLASLLDAFWPYLEWDVVFDNARVVAETGLAPAPFTGYAPGLFRFALDGGFRYPTQPLPALLGGSARRGASERPVGRALPLAMATPGVRRRGGEGGEEHGGGEHGISTANNNGNRE